MSGDGVHVSVLEYIKPLQPGEAGKLRDRLKELNEKLRASNSGNISTTTGKSVPTSTPVSKDKSTTASASAGVSTPFAGDKSGAANPSAIAKPSPTAGNPAEDKSPTTYPTPIPDAKAATDTALATGTPAAADSPPAKWTEGDEKELREIRLKLAQFQRRSTNVAIAERVRLQVAIDPGAAAGKHELRLVTKNGITNPIYFFVGRLPEWSKAPAGTVTEDEVNEQGNLRKRMENPAPTPVVEVSAPLIVNGQMAAGGVDRYSFMARKGTRLVAAASARELIPYIADAVPGWFQASLTLYDAGGKEVQYADHYGFHPDPVLLYEVPADGKYTLAIHDSIYRGREDFVYRIVLGEVPFVTAMFPLGGKAGGKTNVEFSGWNLPRTRLTEKTHGKDKDKDKDKRVELLSVGEEEFNARPFALDTLPETLAKENINARERAQKLGLPVIVNGRVASKNECEFFQLKGKAGEEIEAEVYARRLDSPLDSLLTLTDSKGKLLAENDDFPDESAGLLTDQADSLLRTKLPSKGPYSLRLCDTQRNGGPEFAYRLRVSQPRPDFDLRIVPSSVNAKAGSIVPITVHALRRGGFAGDIALSLKDAPPGFQLSGAVIPGNRSQERITLRLPENGNGQLFRLALEGVATIGDKQVRRKSLAADDWTQAFSYHHLIATNELLIAVNGRQSPQVKWSWREAKPLALLAGRSVAVKFDLPRTLASRVQLSLSSPPDGIVFEKTVPYEGGIVAYIKADGVKAMAGLEGNLIVTATIERPDAQKKGKSNSQTEFLPAVPFEVFPSTSAAVTDGESSTKLTAH